MQRKGTRYGSFVEAQLLSTYVLACRSELCTPACDLARRSTRIAQRPVSPRKAQPRRRSHTLERCLFNAVHAIAGSALPIACGTRFVG
jgi:hypothetical protein